MIIPGLQFDLFQDSVECTDVSSADSSRILFVLVTVFAVNCCCFIVPIIGIFELGALLIIFGP